MGWDQGIVFPVDTSSGSPVGEMVCVSGSQGRARAVGNKESYVRRVAMSLGEEGNGSANVPSASSTRRH